MRKSRVIYFCMFFLTLLFLNFVSALYPCDWTSYGGQLTTAPNYQYYFDCNSKFGLVNFTSKSYPSGNSNKPYQPLVAGLGDFEEPRVIIQSGNYIQVLDYDMNLITEFFVGELVGQLDVGNFLGENRANSIIGLYRINSTFLSYRVLRYNETDLSLDLITEFNFSMGNGTSTNGVRCLSGDTKEETKCYSVVYSGNSTNSNNYFFEFNITEYVVGYYINSSRYNVIEPVSFSDWDEDGDAEFLIFSSDKLFIFNRDTNTLEKEMNTGTTSIKFVGAKFYYPLEYQSLNWFQKLFYPNANKGRLVIVKECMYSGSGAICNGGYSSVQIEAYKPDFSLLWSDFNSATYGISNNAYSLGIGIADYNGDGKDDVWTAKRLTGLYDDAQIIDIYRGDTGVKLFHNNPTPLISYSYPTSSLTLVRMNYDGTPDFLLQSNGVVAIFDTASQSWIFQSSVGSSSVSNCVPADLNFDGLQDIICSASGITKVFYVNYTNQNAYITSVSFEPSISIIVNQPLNIFIHASDSEADVIYYSHKCDISETNYSNDTTSNLKTCIYNSIGEYNLTLRVKDLYHTNYDYFYQLIVVTQTGTLCGNDICEAGENNVNCPQDCPSPENYTQATETGGMPIPLKIVDTQNTEQGLLPQVYFGMLGFLSNTLSPIILLVFVIFFVLIILTIGTIIKKIAHKIGEMQ